MYSYLSTVVLVVEGSMLKVGTSKSLIPIALLSVVAINPSGWRVSIILDNGLDLVVEI